MEHLVSIDYNYTSRQTAKGVSECQEEDRGVCNARASHWGLSQQAATIFHPAQQRSGIHGLTLICGKLSP